jgi:hypothetical protein
MNGKILYVPVVVLGILASVQTADAQVAAACCAPTVTYYAPAPTVTYYAPTVATPVTAYYAPATTAYYAPATTAYYAPSVPVTTYYAPSVPVTTFQPAPTLVYDPTRFWPRRRWAYMW